MQSLFKKRVWSLTFIWINYRTYIPSSWSTGAGQRRYVSSTIKGFTTRDKEGRGGQEKQRVSQTCQSCLVVTISSISAPENRRFHNLNYLQIMSLFGLISLRVYRLNNATWLHFNSISEVKPCTCSQEAKWSQIFQWNSTQRAAFLQNQCFVVYCLKTSVSLSETPVPTISPQLLFFWHNEVLFLSSWFLGKRFQQAFSPKRVCLSWQGESIPQNWGNQQTRVDCGCSSLETPCRTGGRGGATLPKTAQRWYKLAQLWYCSEFIFASTLHLEWPHTIKAGWKGLRDI